MSLLPKIQIDMMRNKPNPLIYIEEIKEIMKDYQLYLKA